MNHSLASSWSCNFESLDCFLHFLFFSFQIDSEWAFLAIRFSLWILLNEKLCKNVKISEIKWLYLWITFSSNETSYRFKTWKKCAFQFFAQHFCPFLTVYFCTFLQRKEEKSAWNELMNNEFWNKQECASILFWKCLLASD